MEHERGFLPGKETVVMRQRTVRDRASRPNCEALPAATPSKVKADQRGMVAYRAISLAEPSSWQDSDTVSDPGSGTWELNTDVSVSAGASLTNKQLAFAVRAQTGGTNPMATIGVVDSFRY